MRCGFLSAFLIALSAFFLVAPAWADANSATPAAIEWKTGGTAYLAGFAWALSVRA